MVYMRYYFLFLLRYMYFKKLKWLEKKYQSEFVRVFIFCYFVGLYGVYGIFIIVDVELCFVELCVFFYGKNIILRVIFILCKYMFYINMYMFNM